MVTGLTILFLGCFFAFANRAIVSAKPHLTFGATARYNRCNS